MRHVHLLKPVRLVVQPVVQNLAIIIVLQLVQKQRLAQDVVRPVDLLWVTMRVPQQHVHQLRLVRDVATYIKPPLDTDG